MAKDKDRTLNPAAAARKAEKDKAKKKGKAAILAQRTERLSRQNPARLERQIADLRALEQSGKPLSARDKKQLEELERDVGRIHKAREGAGGKGANRDGRDGRSDRNDRTDRDGRNGRGEHGQKRRWDERDGSKANGRRAEHRESSGSETDESVRRIPMPRDTPPPVPTRRRRGQHGADGRGQHGVGGGGQHGANGGGQHGSNGAGQQDINERSGENTAGEHGRQIPLVQSKTVYEAAPVVKDLRKEAAAFVPSVVRRKIDATKGAGGKLLEAEELDRLEEQGYGAKSGGVGRKSGGGVDEVGQSGGDERREGGERQGRDSGGRPGHAMVEDVSDQDL